MNKINSLFSVAVLAAAITACSGGGSVDVGNGEAASGSNSETPSGSSPDAVPGLELPESMSVVTATDSGGSSKLTTAKGGSLLAKLLSRAYDDAGTQYSTDSTNTQVYDESMESLDTVNMILCLMEQTSASEMVNKGEYTALVNEDKCERSGGQEESGGANGQASSSQATEYSSWVVRSSRESDASPQVVNIWVPADENESDGVSDPRDKQSILIELTATEGVSDTSPFGSFSMNFKGVVDAGEIGGNTGDEVVLMSGNLQTVKNDLGQPQFKFVNLGGDAITGGSSMNYAFRESANVMLDNAEGTGGVALTRNAFSFSDGPGPVESHRSTFAIAFNEALLLRGKDTTGDDNANARQCKSRTEFNTQVWRYNLYHADDGDFNGRSVKTGDRVALNSGFPFTFDSNDDGTDDEFGWVGYHGVWSGGKSLEDGAVINKFDFSSETKIPHRVNIAPGKMTRRTASAERLSEFQGDEFQYWGEHPELPLFGEWAVTIDENNEFRITGLLEHGDRGRELQESIDDDKNPGTPEVDVSASLELDDNEHIWLWSNSLGGNIAYVHDSSLAASDREVTFFGEEFITPLDTKLFPSGTTSAGLYCYSRCLIGGLTQADIDAAKSEHDLYHQYDGTPFEYTVSIENGKVLLTDSSNDELVSAVGLNLNSLGIDWGLGTGEMVTSPLASATKPWMIFKAAESYRFESGNHDWNRMVTITDSSGNIAKFDRPLRMSYIHSTANDANGNSRHDGDKFVLDYQGHGELHGFPWVGDKETGRWHAAVTLLDGVVLSDGSNDFIVKAIDKEQTMQSKDASVCSDLNIDSLFSDTTLALPNASDIGSINITLSEAPIITDAPAVIEGELQE